MKALIKKTIFCFSFCLLTIINLFSQTVAPSFPNPENRFWRILEKAELAFEVGKFEEAFYLVEKAKENRKIEMDWTVYTLDEALKPLPVQKVGDNISEVLIVLEERNSTKALNIINELIKKYGSLDFFDNSLEKLYIHLNKYYNFPEADYLTGKLFFIEGEYKLARDYYLNAWKNSEQLDIPDVKYDILYDIANLAQIQNNFDEYEKTLLLIVADEDDETQTEMMKRSLNITKSLNQFMSLYRNDKDKSLNAYLKLTSFYLENNKIDKALDMSLNYMVTVFSQIERIFIERNSEYKYISIDNVLMNCSFYQDIVQWGKKNDIWKGFYEFAEVLEINGKNQMSLDLLEALYKHCPDNYWSKMAYTKLLKIIK